MLVVMLGGVAVPVRGAVGFDDLPPQSEAPTDQAMRAATRQVWAKLHGQAAEPAEVADDLPRIVILSISDGQHPAKVVHAGGRGLLAAAEAAAARLPAGSKPKWLRLDVVTRVAPVTKMRDTFVGAYQPARDGLAIGQGDRQITLLSSQLLGGGFIDDQRLVVDALRLDVPGFADLWDARPVRLQRFSTVGMCYDGDRLIPLLDGYRNLPEPSADELLDIANQAGRYLTQAVDDDGRFDYNYDPVTDSIDDDYNNVRHAGVLYAMAELYGTSPDPDLLAAIRRATDFLLALRREEKTPDGKDVAFIVDRTDQISLGGTAVALLALTEIINTTGRRDLLPLADRFADWIINAQDDRGYFTFHVMTWPQRRVVDYRSPYYTGEAVLALIRLYMITKDDRLLQAAVRSTRWQITTVVPQADSDVLHDHWMLYSSNDVSRFVRDQLIVKFCARLTRLIAASQHDGQYDRLWAGGWYVPPRSTPAATRAEGLGAARQVFLRFDDRQNASLARDVMKRSITYQLRTYVGPGRAMFFRNPARVHGAFTGSLVHLNVRNDFLQHNISALLAYRRILLEKSP